MTYTQHPCVEVVGGKPHPDFTTSRVDADGGWHHDYFEKHHSG